ncbi:MAG: MFS transporter [Bryobacterales bacterium]|nr:MFS transporter [Bryobacterales bacterium]
MIKIPRIAWVIAFLLFAATLINYADRSAIGVVSVEIRKEFTLDDQDYGFIVAAFMFAYAIGYSLSGYFIDRLGTRRGFAIFISGWSIAQLLHAFAVGKWSLTGFRFLLGLFEPGNFPAAAKAVAEWFPATRRAFAVGIFNAGSTMGSMIAPPLVAWLTYLYGWRGAFIATGSLGFIWLIGWLLLYQPPHKNRWVSKPEYEELKPHVRPPEEAVAASAGRVSWRHVISLRGCYTLILVRFFTDPVIYFIVFWMPAYLRKERGFDLAMVGKYAWIPYVFGDIGYLLGGWLSGKLMERGYSMAKARKTLLLMGASVMPIGILAPMVPSGEMAIAVTCFVTFGHALWISNLLTIPTDIFKGNEVGTATGFSGAGGALGGVVANLGTGYLVQHFSYSPVFWIAGLMHPMSYLILRTLLKDRYFQEGR